MQKILSVLVLCSVSSGIMANGPERKESSDKSFSEKVFTIFRTADKNNSVLQQKLNQQSDAAYFNPCASKYGLNQQDARRITSNLFNPNQRNWFISASSVNHKELDLALRIATCIQKSIQQTLEKQKS